MRPSLQFYPCSLAFIFAFFFFISFRAFSQDNKFKEVVPPSPTAASLGKYGEIPVGHHTGVPQITIPVHTISNGDISLPISLNYHSSGIKVEDLASWVGLGWSLDAGGMITRTVVGAPDEGNTMTSHSDMHGKGWYKDHGIDPGFLDPNCEVNPNAFQQGAATTSTCFFRYHDAAAGAADTEPDLYSFNFAGYNGKFFFDQFGRPVLQPLQDIKITVSADFASWTIVTPDGSKYFFGGDPATERNYFGPTGQCCTAEYLSSKTWYLNRIENFNGTRSITLEYVPENYSYTIRPSHSVTANGLGVIPISASINIAPLWTSLVSIQGVRLSKITTNTGTEVIDFISENLRTDISKYGFPTSVNDEGKRLDKIKISTSNSERTFDLSFSYFTSPQGSGFGETLHDLKRLKLDKVQEKSGTTSKAPHQFFYETSVTMARRLSLARDHWGYYNGADANQGLLPDFSIAGHDYTGLANREPDETKMQAWMLKKIIYPTGGSSEFVFEAHRQSLTNIVGGLRIKQIKTYDDTGSPPRIKNYSYDLGHLYAGNPEYVQNTASHEYPSAPLPDLGYIVSSNIRSSLKTTQGYHIGYSVVIVEEPGNGKSTYRYFNSTPGTDFYYPNAPTQYELGTGDLFEETHQDVDGVVVQSTTNHFITDFASAINAKRVVSASCVQDCGSCAGAYEGSTGGLHCHQYVLVRNYTIRIGRRLLATRLDYKDGVMKTTYYTYSPNHNKPLKVNTITSDGKVRETVSDYTKDRYVPACTINDSECRSAYQTTLSNLEQDLKNGIANCESTAAENCDEFSDIISSDCIEWGLYGVYFKNCERNCIRRKTGDCISSSNLISIYQNGVRDAEQLYISCRNSTIADYEACVNASLTSLNNADKILAKMITGNLVVSLEDRNYLDNAHIGGSRSVYDFQNDLLLPVEFYNYEPPTNVWTKKANVNYYPTGNIKEYIKASDYPVSYLWGYSNALPIAEIKNAAANKVFYTGFEDETGSYSSLCKTGRKGYSGEYIVTLPSSGTYTLSYWKLNGSVWEHVTVNDVTTNQTIGGSGIFIDDVRLYPKGALMTTYTYDPGVGITSATDANNIITYYTYDSLNRLKLIRDHKGNILKEYRYNYKIQN